MFLCYGFFTEIALSDGHAFWILFQLETFKDLLTSVTLRIIKICSRYKRWSARVQSADTSLSARDKWNKIHGLWVSRTKIHPVHVFNLDATVVGLEMATR